METWLQNEGFHQYLVLSAGHLDLDSFEINMLIRFENRSLLPLEFQCQDGEVNISYDISGAESLKQMFQAREMDEKILGKIFTSLRECHEELEKHLLSVEGLLLLPEQIYYLPGKKQIRFCYLPGHSREVEFTKSFLSLVEFCMKRTKHQDSKAVLFIYGFYRLLQEETVEWEEVDEYIRAFEVEKQEKEDLQQKKELKWKGEPFSQTGESGWRSEEGEEAGAPIVTERMKSRTFGGIRYVYGSLSVLFCLGGLISGIRYLFMGHRETDIKLFIIMMILLVVFFYGMIRCRQMNIQKEPIPKHGEEDRNVGRYTERSAEKSLGGSAERSVERNLGRTAERGVEKALERSAGGGAERSMERSLGKSAERSTENCIEGNEANSGMITQDIVQEPSPEEYTEMEETSVLTADMTGEAIMWELEGMQVQVPNIALQHLPGILGRKPEEADYIVTGDGISRCHVLLFLSGEDLYAEDLASTNGTYKNGMRLNPGEPMKLCDGDRLSIGPNQYQVTRKSPML